MQEIEVFSCDDLVDNLGKNKCNYYTMLLKRTVNHVNSYLVKPVGFDEFSKLMNDLGFYWLGWNTHPRI